MEAWQAVLLALLALLVGVSLPVLFQLVLTLRAAHRMIARAGPALASITATAERLDRFTNSFEEGGHIETALASINKLSATASKLHEVARLVSSMGTAVIPAVAAAVQAWQATEADAVEPPGGPEAGKAPISEGAP